MGQLLFAMQLLHVGFELKVNCQNSGQCCVSVPATQVPPPELLPDELPLEPPEPLPLLELGNPPLLPPEPLPLLELGNPPLLELGNPPLLELGNPPLPLLFRMHVRLPASHSLLGPESLSSAPASPPCPTLV